VASRTSLLKSLGVAQLKELAGRHDLSLPSGKKSERVAFLAEKLSLSDAELEAVVRSYQADKLIGKIRDARDYFLTRQVSVEHVSDMVNSTCAPVPPSGYNGMRLPLL